MIALVITKNAVFSISSGDVSIFTFCKVRTVGDLIFSKLDFMTATRRPGVCGSKSFSVFFIALALKVFGFNCSCVFCFSLY